MNEFRNALDFLVADQREALILVAASGFSYEEAAQICGWYRKEPGQQGA